MNRVSPSRNAVGTPQSPEARTPFGMVDLPKARSTTKPRRNGRTMVVDWGLTLEHLEATLRLASPYIDLGKIAVGTSRLYPEDYLKAKLDLYKSYQVRPFLGGQFQEYVYATMGKQALKPFLEEAVRIGFEVVEVSDNCVPLSPTERREQIALARSVGLAVLGEVGSKSDKNDADTLIAQATDAFEAGAELVLVEGAELIEGGRPKTDLLGGLENGLDMSRVLIELPGPWIKGVVEADIHDMKKMLVAAFGPDVNLANVLPDNVIETESLRVGLGVVGPKVAAAG